MKTLREVDIQPLDPILFQGVDAVSRAICFMEEKKLGHGGYSHMGLAVTREILDLPFLEPGKLYVWESTLSAKEGFWAKFTDRVPDAETEGVRFGVQLRDLEMVIPGYEAAGGRVAWASYHGPRPSLEAMRRELMALYDEYGHSQYTSNLLNVFGVVFPALRSARDLANRAEDRMAHFMNNVLARADNAERVKDADHHLFCSQWCATVYTRLGMAMKDFDPLLAAPVDVIAHTEYFREPVPLGSETQPAEESEPR